MTEENNMSTGSGGDASQSHATQVKVSMQQSEHSGQPMYSNFTSVQGGQGVIIVDFGFLDPHTMHALSQMARSDVKPSGAISAKMSCRMAISIDAANQLALQLNQLLHKKTTMQAPVDQQKVSDQIDKTASSTASTSNTALVNEKNSAAGTAENNSGGFRFPWSRKKH